MDKSREWIVYTEVPETRERDTFYFKSKFDLSCEENWDRIDKWINDIYLHGGAEYCYRPRIYEVESLIFDGKI